MAVQVSRAIYDSIQGMRDNAQGNIDSNAANIAQIELATSEMTTHRNDYDAILADLEVAQ